MTVICVLRGVWRAILREIPGAYGPRLHDGAHAVNMNASQVDLEDIWHVRRSFRVLMCSDSLLPRAQ